MPKFQQQFTEVLAKKAKFYLPAAKVLKSAKIKIADYKKWQRQAEKFPERFWGEAAEELDWYRKWDKVLDKSKAPFYQWFVGGRCNIFYNAVERHQQNPAVRDKVAILWEDEAGGRRTLTYGQLYQETNQLAGVLKQLGVGKGDRVSVYLPNIPETAAVMLACAKIGAIHSLVYAGFSALALRERILDAGAKILVTADGSRRRGKIIELKKIADEALAGQSCPSIKRVIVVNHVGTKIKMRRGRDQWYGKLIKKPVPVVATAKMKATDPLFILYTSGTTAKPKGVVHCHGGYMVGVHRTASWIFDLRPDDIFWCTADPGWITGHSYLVYGPLMAGVTTVMYEGVPDYPRPDRIWKMIAKNKITILYTAPTLVRLMMKYGNLWPKKYNLKSLRLLGSVGEPINAEAWRWFYKYVGGGRCPILDTWWQTETGMVMIAPLPALPLKAGSATRPFFGVKPAIVDRRGRPVPTGKGGFLVIKNPWPAMLVTLFHNPKRYLKTYWQKIPGFYTTGDVAFCDRDGYFWLQGRADDVLNISGHRIGTAEIESAVATHPAVVEAGVIGRPHPVKGEVAKGFVILKAGRKLDDALTLEIKQQARETLGPMAIIEEIVQVEKLPKTRSGKIMRRVLKAKELGLPVGDVSTLED